MTVSGVSSGASPSGSAAAASTERTILVLKKEQDAARVQAQALVELINDASSTEVGRRLSVYA